MFFKISLKPDTVFFLRFIPKDHQNQKITDYCAKFFFLFSCWTKFHLNSVEVRFFLIL